MSDYRDTLLRETREEIAKADAKASILLATSGIIVTALVTVGATSDWSPAHLHVRGARFIAWAGIVLTGAGIVAVSAAVKPRLGAKDPVGKPHFFGDVEAYRPTSWKRKGRKQLIERARTDFGAAIGSMSADDVRTRFDDEIWTCSHIAYRKFRLLSIAMTVWAVAIACGIASLMLEQRWP